MSFNNLLISFHPETPDEKLVVSEPVRRDFFVLARKSRDCAEAYDRTPHKQDRRLTPPGRKSTLSGRKTKRGSRPPAPPHQLLLFAESRMSRGQTSDGHPEGGAGNIVKTDLVAEDDGGGVAAMLAADAELDVAPGGAPLVAPHFDQLSDAVLIEGDEGVLGKESGLDVEGKELACIVPGEAESGLRQVVGAEGEEFRLMGNLIGGEGSAGQ